MMIAVVLIVGLLMPMSMIDANSPSLSLATLCRGEKVKLRTINQLDSLIGELESSDGGCPDTVKDALRDMKKLTNANGADVCTMDQARAITSFVDRYLKDAPDGTKRGLPEPLEKFAIAYGMKVSGICSHRMVRELPMESGFEHIMNWNHHMDEFLALVAHDSPVGNVLDPIIKTGEVILPVDLMQAIPGLVKHVNLLVPKEMGMLKFKRLCEKVFQPLYEPLLLPLAHLIRAGFNNRERYWAWRYHYKGRLWSRAVFLCEIAKMVDLDPKAQISDPDKAAVAEALKDMEMGVISRYQARVEFTTLPVGRNPVKTGNTIYGRFDYSMKSLVKAFDANKDHVELLRERILKRSFRVARRMFKKQGFSAELMKALKAARVRSGSEADFEAAKEKFVSLMNSPQDDSLAYKSLVSSSKWIYDHIVGLIGFSIYFGPAFLLALFTPDPLVMKVAHSVDGWFADRVATRDRGAWRLPKSYN